MSAVLGNCRTLDPSNKILKSSLKKVDIAASITFSPPVKLPKAGKIILFLSVIKHLEVKLLFDNRTLAFGW